MCDENVSVVDKVRENEMKWIRKDFFLRLDSIDGLYLHMAPDKYTTLYSNIFATIFDKILCAPIITIAIGWYIFDGMRAAWFGWNV